MFLLVISAMFLAAGGFDVPSELGFDPVGLAVVPTISGNIAEDDVPAGTAAGSVADVDRRLSVPGHFTSATIYVLGTPSAGVGVPVTMSGVSVVCSIFLVVVVPDAVRAVPDTESG